MKNIRFFKEVTRQRKIKYEQLCHSIDLENPHPGSWAAAILLRKQFFQPLEKEVIKTIRKELKFHEKFRRIFFNQIVEQQGTLSCHYCGNYPLQRDSKEHKLLATLDHVIPISKGGDKYNPENIVVACGHCNSQRGNKDIKNFKPKRTELNFEKAAA